MHGRRDDLSELSDVLAAEFKAIYGSGLTAPDIYGADAPLDDALQTASDTARQSETRLDRQVAAIERARRRLLYRRAHSADLQPSALCLSGGGIRSAAIALGMIQALVDRKLLSKFNYLSTVSGGGYIGSWLSAWLHYNDNTDGVISRLGSRRNNPDAETAPLLHLRRYSSYLTPAVGAFSADTWAALVIILRNILINWLILVPGLTLLVAAVLLLTALLETQSLDQVTNVSFFCMALGGLGFGYKLYHLYGPDPVEKPRAAQLRFLFWSLTPIFLAGLCFVWLVLQKGHQTPADALMPILRQWIPLPIWLTGHRIGRMSVFAILVYVIALIVAACRSVPINVRGLPSELQDDPHSLRAIWFRLRNLPAGLKVLHRSLFFTVFTGYRLFNMDPRDFLGWAAGVLVFSTAVWVGVVLVPIVPAGWFHRSALLVILALPWFLLATLFAHTIYLLLRSGSRDGDVEREWLGRASGWHFIAGISWILLTSIVLLGPDAYSGLYHWLQGVIGENKAKILSALLPLAAGIVTGVLGKSQATPAQGPPTSKASVAANLALSIAGPLFALLLLVLISWAVRDSVPGLVRDVLPALAKWFGWLTDAGEKWSLVLIIVSAAVIMLAADRFANINAFSLHAIYRNRLVRAFLGGARAPHRRPDGFIDFDWYDDLRVASLWKPGLPVGSNWRPFHVINMTLNLSVTDNLAWQQRKAMPFTVTPFSCGSADLGYRPTNHYAGPYYEDSQQGGISLGTAMAISGAAVSSNMGYHSSKSLSFLLTFFNVRLGAWLGNPGKGGEGSPLQLRAPYCREGPPFALVPLLKELFGLTSDRSSYIYLSDGGHFENLGLYEMVRRRCKWIVVCDGAQDAKRGYVDLGNAVRKIWIDLGVRIEFDKQPLLAADERTRPAGMPYFAVGKIIYLSDVPAGVTAPVGHLLYIKPVVRGDEAAADVIAYKRANTAFPQESTANQWFDEPQLESYRRLGHLMVDRLIELFAPNGTRVADLPALFAGLATINPRTM